MDWNGGGSRPGWTPASQEWIDEAHPIAYLTVCEILTEQNSSLGKPRRAPDLSVIEAEAMIPNTPESLEHDLCCERKDCERHIERLDLTDQVCRSGRWPQPAEHYARKLRHGLRRDRCRADASELDEEIASPALLCRVPAVVCVNEDIGIDDLVDRHAQAGPMRRSRSK